MSIHHFRIDGLRTSSNWYVIGWAVLVAFAAFVLAALAAPVEAASAAAPTDPQISVVSEGLQIDWTEPSADEIRPNLTLVGYEVQRGATGTGSFDTILDNSGDTETVFVDSTGNKQSWFLAGSALVYRIVAIYETDQAIEVRSSASSATTVTVPAFPNASNLERSDGANGVDLSWTAPSLSWSSEAPPRTGYQLTIVDDGVASRETLDSDAVSYTHADGDLFAKYRIAVIYGVFRSLESDFPIALARTQALPPTGVSVSMASTGLTVSWAAPSTTDPDLVVTLEGLRLERSTYRTDPYTTVAEDIDASESEYIDSSGGDEDRFYSFEQWWYRVVALYSTDDGASIESEPSGAASIRIPILASATGLSRSDSEGTALLSWTAPAASTRPDALEPTGYNLRANNDRVLLSTTDLPADAQCFEATIPEGGAIYFVLTLYGVFASPVERFPAPTAADTSTQSCATE